MITIEVKGLNVFIANLNKIPEKLRKEGSAILERGAQVFVRNAKRDAPKEFGFLTNLISYAKISDFSFRLVSGSRYSPYVEWGTITKVRVPAELSGYAIQFKGRGIRKNGGMNPHPYFFPQVGPVSVLTTRGFEAMIKDLKL